MKLKGKILSLVIVPLVLFCAISSIFSSREISSVIKSVVQGNLQGVAILARDNISIPEGNAYHLDEAGNLWNGDGLNITAEVDAVDEMKQNTGIDVTVIYGDTRYMTTVKDEKGERVLGTKVSQVVADKVLNGGEAYFAEKVDVVGEPYFAYYLPVYNTGENKPIGMVFTGISQANIEGQIRAVIRMIVMMGIILTVICAAISYFVTNGICKRIQRGVKLVERVAAGDLTIAISKKALIQKDEIGELAVAVNKLSTDLSAIVREIAIKSEQVNKASSKLNEEAEMTAEHISQVDMAVNEIAQGATLQAEETQKTTENIIVMGDMIEKSNQEVDKLHENADNMYEASAKAINTLNDLERINNRTKDAIEIIFNQTNTTNESVMKIKEAISLITDIAEETNLLSLNASIEAARAGEQGRGFAVVAGQIQKLAEQSNASAGKIEEIATTLIDESSKAVDTMKEVREIMVEQSEKVNQTGTMFEQVKLGIDHSIESVTEIAEGTKTLDTTRITVVDAVQSLTSIAEENAASTEETSASVTEVSSIVEGISQNSSELRKIADGLHENIKIFRLSEEEKKEK